MAAIVGAIQPLRRRPQRALSSDRPALQSARAPGEATGQVSGSGFQLRALECSPRPRQLPEDRPCCAGASTASRPITWGQHAGAPCSCKSRHQRLEAGASSLCTRSRLPGGGPEQRSGSSRHTAAGACSVLRRGSEHRAWHGHSALRAAGNASVTAPRNSVLALPRIYPSPGDGNLHLRDIRAFGTHRRSGLIVVRKTFGSISADISGGTPAAALAR